MITLDAILAAISAPDPFTQMDRVVREEMAAGRKVKDIFADINPLVNTVLGTPGLPEDGEEAFLGTLDALTGNCHRDCCYFDPPTLPTEEAIEGLPRWARVAFAARCARRVLPIYQYHMRRTSADRSVEVSRAVELAERSASTARTIAYSIAVVKSSTEAAFDVLSSAPNVILSADVEGAVLSASATAANAAEAASSIANAAKPATNAAANAANSAGFTTHDRERAIQAIHRDFTLLTQLAQCEHWDDDTPVPPQFFGPLWPEGAPPGWPADPNTPRHTELELEIVASKRVIDRIMEDEVVNLFNAINRYHIARGGSPLTLDELLPYLNPSLVPVGA